MTPRHIATLVALASLATATNAFADGGCEASGVIAAYPKAVAAEKAGRLKEALGRYVEVGERSGCKGTPHEKNAAQRAAALALPLAKAAEQKGDLEEALTLYEQGAYLAHADRLLMTMVRAKPDDIDMVARGFKVFGSRELFVRSNPASVAAAGGYAQDQALVAELEAMPGKAVDRALAREATAFNEQYLKDLVQLVQSRPEPKADMQSMMQAALQFANGNTQDQALLAKWPEDLMKKSLAELELVQDWASVGLVNGSREPLVKLGLARAQQRAATLTKVYSGAPELLKAAMGYHDVQLNLRWDSLTTDEQLQRARSDKERAVDQVKAVALKLGDEADARSRFTLSVAYYDVAENEAKRLASLKKLEQVALKQAQPDIDALTKVAATVSNPATIAAMKKRAEAARAAAAAMQKPTAKDSAKSASDLERELGLK